LDGTTAKVTQFDLIVIVLLAVSGLVGAVRGATREVMTVLAFGLAVLAALFSLKFSGPLFHQWIHTVWLANIVAGLVVFVVVYIGVRLATTHMVHTVRRAGHLSLLDRVLGLGFGLARGLVLLGVFQLVFHAATPPERAPKWIVQAALYPLAVDSGQFLRLLAPQGSVVANQLAPALEHAVAESPDSRSDQPVEKPH
jgi:membrane protein required for colicin V production